VSLYERLEKENNARFNALNKSIAVMFVSLVNGLYELSPERDESNKAAATEMPPCEPHSMAQLQPYSFSSIVRKQLSRFQHSLGCNYSDELEEEFKAFVERYQTACGFTALVDNTNDRTLTFEEQWSQFQPEFPKLVEFCGGLASVFPGTSTVESDFSVIGWEKDDHRFHLSDVALEGILQTKQRSALNKIDAYTNGNKD
jgi:hypothetical protein